MRPLVAEWLRGLGLPGWLAPGYATMIALAGFVGVTLFVRLARHDEADVRLEARAIGAGYVAALLGGYLVEGLRALPQAIAAGSLAPIANAGRAAYGGLLAGMLVAALVIRRGGGALWPFLDRLTVVMGAAFVFVRAGCFLAGCDYGVVTAGPLGVRFPADSLAALDHAGRGWVPHGAASLPVHPTQLYESGVGLVASIAAAVWLSRGHRDGRAAGTWLAVYAAGRAGVELWRGDVSRGVAHGVSTAQLVSMLLLAALLLVVAWRRFRPAAAAASVLLLLCAPAAEAQPGSELFKDRQTTAASPPPSQPPPPPPPHEPPPPAMQPPPPEHPPPPPAAPPVQLEDPEEDKPTTQSHANRERVVGLRVGTGLGLPFRFQLEPYTFVDLDVVARIPLGDRHRFEVGGEIGGVFGDVACHLELGVPLAFVFGVAAHYELSVAVVPTYTRVFFTSPYFAPVNAFGLRMDLLGMHFPITPHFGLGVTVATVTLLQSGSVQPILAWEPRFAAEVAF